MRNRDGLRTATISVTVSSLASAGALGVAAIIIARNLGPEGRGVFAASYSLVYVLVIAGSLGAGPGGRRLLALGPARDGATLHEFSSTVRWLTLGQIPLGVVGAVLLLPIFDAGRTLGEQLAFVVCCVTTLASLLAREALYGVGRGQLSALILASGCFATLAGVALVALIGRGSVSTFIWVYAIAGAGEFIASSRKARDVSAHDPPDRAGSTARILSSGRAVLVMLLAQAVATRGDRLVIGAIAGPSELGQYAVAVSVMELLSMASFALGNVAFQGLASGRLSERSMTRARRATVGGTALIALVVIAVAPWLIDVAFGGPFAEAVPALRVLALAAVPYGSYLVDSQHLIAQSRARIAAILTVVAAGAMVVGDILVVPVWGIKGAAWVSVVTYGTAAVLARAAVTRLPAGPAQAES